jgi:D-beta-D-heptose 7-phosphate kinase/D-beta-D-heptose 1-phosphate adenosyltransferase
MTPDRLAALKGVKIAVIGDVMIDEYLTGRVERISPEAPVPVVLGSETRAVPGGAANVAANVAALGGEALLVGLVGPGGRDEFAGLLASGVHAEGLIVDLTRRTTRKTRVISNRQQIVRLDHEDTTPPGAEVEAALIAAALRAVAASDVVVLSDYGKGAFSPRSLRATLDAAKAAGKRVVVDPKRADFSAYRGADVVTPNRAELSRASGLPVGTDAEVEAAARKAVLSFGGALLVTRSEQGMSYIEADRPALHVPTVAREVFDVSGAGDTVVATLAAALAAGFDMAEAIGLANHAAGVVVTKAGTATVSFDELADALDLKTYVVDGEAPQASREEACVWRERWAREGRTVGFANGCFDLLHPGHVALIRQAAAACDRLIVALNADASVRRLKGPSRPVQSEAARATVIGAIKGVALVTVFEEDTPGALIEALRPDLLVKGADYRVEDVVGAAFVAAHGGKVLLVDLVPDQSTTQLLAREREGA